MTEIATVPTVRDLRRRWKPNKARLVTLKGAQATWYAMLHRRVPAVSIEDCKGRFLCGDGRLNFLNERAPSEQTTNGQSDYDYR